MLTKNGREFLALGIILTVACGSVYAQQTVYQWVDEEGVVHYGEKPPDESPKDEVEVFTTDPAPTYVAPAQTTIKSPSASETVVENQSAQPEIQVRSQVKELDISEISLADLDSRCENAREKIIAPLRKAEIEKCIQTGTGDQGWCETFWADYGDSQRTRSGVFIPRQFNDIPECTEALDERHRRVR
jgi:hypothetical protein